MGRLYSAVSWQTDEGICPYKFSITSNRTNNLFTCQPVHSSTLPNHNFEL
ncbi:hypothetical protein HMPREF0973_00618 [Prevotella veroralis F0319]|uniref:Uncharacterized protein n=1 Tax=Prevotella veroralis F0319 TaxID=649761 RepID=C9MLZ2_9BACT|nr:hypothetical protein HMPREF0973_00618 [Prevotella veroralis F0319]